MEAYARETIRGNALCLKVVWKKKAGMEGGSGGGIFLGAYGTTIFFDWYISKIWCRYITKCKSSIILFMILIQ